MRRKGLKEPANSGGETQIAATASTVRTSLNELALPEARMPIANTDAATNPPIDSKILNKVIAANTVQLGGMGCELAELIAWKPITAPSGIVKKVREPKIARR